MMEQETKTPLPAVLQNEFMANYVEEIPRDIRQSAVDAIHRIYSQPENYPSADWVYLEEKDTAILSVYHAWMQ